MQNILSWLRRRALNILLLFGGVLLPLYLFGALAEDVIEREIFAFDRPLQLAIHAHAAPAFDTLMLAISTIGSIPILAPLEAILLLWLLVRRAYAKALFWLLALGGTGLLNLSAKHVFSRVRPDLWPSLRPETTFSFPSGHAMHSMALAAALLALCWHTRARWPLLVAGAAFVLLVGLSRIYLGVHYPSDILAGWCASLAWIGGLTLLFSDAGRLRRPR